MRSGQDATGPGADLVPGHYTDWVRSAYGSQTAVPQEGGEGIKSGEMPGAGPN